VIVDSTQQVWVVAYNLGLFLYKYDGTYTQPNNSNAMLLLNLPGRGGLPSIQIISIAEDKNRDIWVGTDKGVYVFYNPESISPNTTGWDAQPIYIQQDGKTQLLLQTEEVICIAVDGANNKWFGTKSGVYCFSPDGQKQLYHFTTDNSPLFSNTITALRVSPTTGEVFIGTDKGLLSFQNTVIEGFDKFTGVYAYPNPVKPNYDGPILIHGMINGATVKIIDVAGNFVYETTSKGGQAVWDGKNFSGQRVASGVYLVLCSTSDGDKQVMTKILVLN
jgi:ligand-binding sensor domain-containing protein